MPRKPDSKIQDARQLYENGMKLIDIAKTLNVPPGTVRRWKSIYNWGNEQNKASVRKNKNERSAKKRAISEDIEQSFKNPELTDKQQLFCLYFVRCFNATKAYQKAYGCNYYTAKANGYKLLRNDVIKDEIDKLKQVRLNREFLNEQDIFQKYIDIAFADITEYVEFGTDEYNTAYVKLNNSSEIDGTLISEISKGRSGVKIKLVDKMKALDWLTEHMNLATEEQCLRIKALKEKTGQGKRDTTLFENIANAAGGFKTGENNEDN